jgi:hypothetical protein
MEDAVPTVCFESDQLTQREIGILTVLITLLERTAMMPFIAADALTSQMRSTICEDVATTMRQHFPDLTFYVEDSVPPPASPRVAR